MFLVEPSIVVMEKHPQKKFSPTTEEKQIESSNYTEIKTCINTNTESEKKSSTDTNPIESLYSQYYPGLTQTKYRDYLLTPEEMDRLTGLEQLSIADIERIRHHVIALVDKWSLARKMMSWTLIQFMCFGSSRAAGAIKDNTPWWNQPEPPEDEDEEEEMARIFDERPSGFAEVATDPEKRRQYKEQQEARRPKSRWDFVPEQWQQFICNSAKGLVDGFVAATGRKAKGKGGFAGYLEEYFPDFVSDRLLSLNRGTIGKVREYDLPCLGVYRNLGTVTQHKTRDGQPRTTQSRPMAGVSLQVALIAYEALEDLINMEYERTYPRRKGGFFAALPDHKNSFAVRAFNYTFKYLDLGFGSLWKVSARDGYEDQTERPQEPTEQPTEQSSANTVEAPSQPVEEKEEVEPIKVAAIALEALANSGLDPALISQTEQRVKKKAEQKQAVFVLEQKEKEKHQKQILDLDCNKSYAIALNWKRKVAESYGAYGRQLIQIFSEWEDCRQICQEDPTVSESSIHSMIRIDLKQLKAESQDVSFNGSPFWQICFGTLSGILQGMGFILNKAEDKFKSIHTESLVDLYQSLQGFYRIASQL